MRYSLTHPAPDRPDTDVLVGRPITQVHVGVAPKMDARWRNTDVRRDPFDSLRRNRIDGLTRRELQRRAR